MTCRGRHWFKQVSERKRRGNLNGNRIAKSLSIVQCMCDIHPMLPNQCSSAELKNLPGGIIYLPWTTGAKGLLFLSCVALSLLLFVQNKMRLFNTLNWLKTTWFCHWNSYSRHYMECKFLLSLLLSFNTTCKMKGYRPSTSQSFQCKNNTFHPDRFVLMVKLSFRVGIYYLGHKQMLWDVTFLSSASVLKLSTFTKVLY